jgi:hypothetical protein
MLKRQIVGMSMVWHHAFVSGALTAGDDGRARLPGENGFACPGTHLWDGKEKSWSLIDVAARRYPLSW